MSRYRRSQFRATNNYLLRIPRLSVQSLFVAERNLLNGNFNDLDASVRSALEIGSPSLARRLIKSNGKDKEALQKALRFIRRMGLRPTPYGSFAGVAIGSWGEKTTIQASADWTFRARPDMTWIVALVKSLEAVAAIRNSLSWTVRSDSTVRGQKLYFGKSTANGLGRQRKTSVTLTPMLQTVLEVTKKQCAYPDLVAKLVTFSRTKDETAVHRYLAKLWEHDAFTTNLLPPPTHSDPVGWILGVLSPISGTGTIVHQLATLRSLLSSCQPSRPDFSARLKTLAAYTNLICPTEAKVPQFDAQFLLSGGEVGKAVREGVERLAAVLMRISPMPRGPSYLDSYKDRFKEKYGQTAEVPLLQLIDPENGLGLPDSAGNYQDNFSSARLRRTSRLLAIAHRAIRLKELCVELSEDDLGALELDAQKIAYLPVSLDLNVFICAQSANAIDRGDYQIVLGPNVGAPSGGQHIGRFHGLVPDGDLLTPLQECKRAHTSDDAILADILYYPQDAHYANVVLRPSIHEYELTYSCAPSVPSEQTLSIGDLTVGLSGGQFYVRSLSLDRQVNFQSFHMLNPRHAPAAIQLLQELRRQSITQLCEFDWGQASFLEFLPRLTVGNLVLSVARWKLGSETLGEDANESPLRFFELFSKWRSECNVPDWVYLVAGDNRLAINLNRPEEVAWIRKELKKSGPSGACILQELLPGPRDAWFPAPGQNHHVVELSVPLILRNGGEHKKVILSKSVYDPFVGRHLPNGEWIYLKVYGPKLLQDEVLLSFVGNVIEPWESEISKKIDWFFVRYSDFGNHLRLRIKVTDFDVAAAIQSRLTPWLRSMSSMGSLSSVTYDTYEQEVIRYGGVSGMSFAEEVFFKDTRVAVAILRESEDKPRLPAAARSVHNMISSMGLGSDEALSWLKDTSARRSEAGQRYRKVKDSVIAALSSTDGISAEIGEAGSDLMLLLRKGSNFTYRDALLRNLVHMHCNRLGFDNSEEADLLAFLYRALNSLRAQASSAEMP